MGKRKKAKAPPKKARPKVATIFDCPFCGKNQSCSVKMQYDVKLGTIECDSCGVTYSSRIDRLHEPIDVYSEWIDQCENVNIGGGAGPSSGRRDPDDYNEDEDED
mmetsp:Transcript_3671/g.7835  ORF Transcript_3671/g.7835 Transcript_3671/m.7835 type:complete len:105 (-) Transcript_3671:405-719(-)|eukprot:CAMPEP_0183352616 /NCGR_PEP_ID=MMETSP0164_2-20130417/29553_1 /TAXON_ID=221442 /ORGANISM="Coccolithus pelagicus ssp braarudi, Strain PLY182g" /LENGTH=104 /DNA_ID=CAMNT_0025525093 /DNA_START=31 /DNA_END=345 /DNA_ORIENTATION=-